MSPILIHFTYAHLPEDLQKVSKPFCDLAHQMEEVLKSGPEKSTALRKLLEAKDAAVRAAVEMRFPQEQEDNMRWGDIDYRYHNRKAKVWADSTPDNPKHGVPPTIGYIDCSIQGEFPILKVGTLAHTFAHWYQVELLD